MQSQSTLFRVREVAARLAISERMVRNLIERGDLPCVRIGAAVRVAQSDLDAYVETLRQDRGES